MKYDLSIDLDKEKAMYHFSQLVADGAKIELKKVLKPRSLSQNSYLHVVITLYAVNYGCSINEAKTDLKRGYGLIYEKKGQKYLRSTADLDTKELTDFIDYIRTKSSKDLLIYIPTAEEYLTNKFNIDKEIERNKEYL